MRECERCGKHRNVNYYSDEYGLHFLCINCYSKEIEDRKVDDWYFIYNNIIYGVQNTIKEKAKYIIKDLNNNIIYAKKVSKRGTYLILKNNTIKEIKEI